MEIIKINIKIPSIFSRDLLKWTVMEATHPSSTRIKKFP
jgi:hypothetical protein